MLKQFIEFLKDIKVFYISQILPFQKKLLVYNEQFKYKNLVIGTSFVRTFSTIDNCLALMCFGGSEAYLGKNRFVFQCIKFKLKIALKIIKFKPDNVILVLGNDQRFILNKNKKFSHEIDNNLLIKIAYRYLKIANDIKKELDTNVIVLDLWPTFDNEQTKLALRINKILSKLLPDNGIYFSSNFDILYDSKLGIRSSRASSDYKNKDIHLSLESTLEIFKKTLGYKDLKFVEFPKYCHKWSANKYHVLRLWPEPCSSPINTFKSQYIKRTFKADALGTCIKEYFPKGKCYNLIISDDSVLIEKLNGDIKLKNIFFLGDLNGYKDAIFVNSLCPRNRNILKIDFETLFSKFTFNDLDLLFVDLLGGSYELTPVIKFFDQMSSNTNLKIIIISDEDNINKTVEKNEKIRIVSNHNQLKKILNTI